MSITLTHKKFKTPCIYCRVKIRINKKMSNKKVEFEIIHANKLIPYKKNPRKNKNAIRKVANSIKLNGFAAPIVANYNYEVLAGHTRLAAVKLLQKEEPKEDYSMVPVRFINITGEQAKLYRIQDNRLGEFSEWDDDLLAEQLEELQISFSEELSDLFSDDELKELLDNKEESIEDFSETDLNFVYQILVTNLDESTQKALLEKLESEGYKCQPLVI